MRQRPLIRKMAMPSRILDAGFGIVTMRTPCESRSKRNTVERKRSILAKESRATVAALVLSHVGTDQFPVGAGRRPTRHQKAPAKRSTRTRLKSGTLRMVVVPPNG